MAMREGANCKNLYQIINSYGVISHAAFFIHHCLNFFYYHYLLTVLFINMLEAVMAAGHQVIKFHNMKRK